MQANVGALSAKNIWGKVVLFLKEHRMTALHVACGDITDVGLDQNNLIVRVEDGMLADLMKEGRRDIESALRWQGLDISLKVEIIQKQISDEEKDIAKLKTVLGDYLIVK